MNHHSMGEYKSADTPARIEAEQTLLGSIFVNNDAYHVACETGLTADDFYEDLHRDIFAACGSLIDADKKANPVSVQPYIGKDYPITKELSAHQYIGKLVIGSGPPLLCASYAEAIIASAVCRSLISCGDGLLGTGFSKTENADILAETIASKEHLDYVIDRLEGPASRGATIGNAAGVSLDQTADSYKHGVVTGIDVRFSPIGGMTGPFRGGQLIIMGGATKQGKTALVGQIAANVAAQGIPVWMYSGELRAEELSRRVMAQLTGVTAWRQADGKVGDVEYEKLDKARDVMMKWPWSIIDRRMTLKALVDAIKRHNKRNPESLYMVDHIGLIERDNDTRRMQGWEFGEHVTGILKGLAMTLNVCIIACAQLKKNTLAHDKGTLSQSAFDNAVSRRPRYSDIIGGCERDADHVLIPFRAEPILQEIEPPERHHLHEAWETLIDDYRGKAEIILALSRHKTWPQYRSVGWKGETTQFVDTSSNGQGAML